MLLASMDSALGGTRLLPVHITAGVAGILSGFVALYALKGGRVHRKSGLVFVVAMLTLSLTGAVIATLRAEPINVIAGCTTFYMVSTALLTVRRPAPGWEWLDAGATAFGAGVGAFGLALGLGALRGFPGPLGGDPPVGAAVFGAVAVLSVIGDLRRMAKGGGSEIVRLTRHLWRMCLGLFVATGSFFLGQAKVFPKPIRIMPLLAMPVLLVLGLLLYWLVRVRVLKRDPRRA
jgi:uncharacterized membrane protein